MDANISVGLSAFWVLFNCIFEIETSSDSDDEDISSSTSNNGKFMLEITFLDKNDRNPSDDRAYLREYLQYVLTTD